MFTTKSKDSFHQKTDSGLLYIRDPDFKSIIFSFILLLPYFTFVSGSTVSFPTVLLHKRWFCLEEVAINNSYRKPSFSRNMLLQKFKPISPGEMDSRRKLLKMASCRKRRKGKEIAQQCPRGNNPATRHYSCIICKNMCSISKADVPKLCHL